jgi:cation diffusion facilitator family transporter
MDSISAKKVIYTSLVVDLIDIITNVVVALLTGSIVMAAETLQGMADITAVSFLLIGLVRSNRPADRAHPFGFGREIYFWTLISSIIMLGFTATLSFFLGFQRFLHPEALDNLNLAYIVLTIAIFTNGYALSLDVKRILGKKKLSSILHEFLQSAKIETKTTFVLDLMGVGAAICGLLSLFSYRYFSNQRLDGVGAMAIGLVLASLSLLLIFGVRDLLIGKRASKEIESNIKDIVLTFSEVSSIVDLKTQHSGSSLYINLDLNLKDKLNTNDIEKLVEEIKSKIRKSVPSATEIQIEPQTS